MADGANGLARGRRFSRSQAAKHLGCSISTIRRAEERGDLTPHTDGWGTTRYTSEDIARYGAKRARPTDPGGVAASAFAMFDLGERLTEVVKQLRIPVPLALVLYDQWRALKDHDTLGAEPVTLPNLKAARPR